MEWMPQVSALEPMFPLLVSNICTMDLLTAETSDLFKELLSLSEIKTWPTYLRLSQPGPSRRDTGPCLLQAKKHVANKPWRKKKLFPL